MATNAGYWFDVRLLAALGCALIAGVFCAFSGFVMAALARLPPPQGIAAMQSINVAVVNPAFLLIFLGTAAACLFLLVGALTGRFPSGARLLVVGSLLYLAGTLLVTVAVNVPLNDRLAAIDPSSGARGAEIWADYLRQWTIWNHVRGAAALAAAASLIVALCQRATESR